MRNIAIYDSDFIKYRAACACEKRSIVVSNESIGYRRAFKTRTAFWGRGGKIGGVLEKLNKKLPAPLSKEDFLIEDVYVPEPIEKLYASVDGIISTANWQSGASKAYHFVGKEVGFRLDRSTLIRYKGERKDTRKPFHLDNAYNYLIEKHKAEYVGDRYEVDDVVIIESYNKKDRFVIAEDKDARSQPVLLFDVNRPEQGVIESRGFGKIYWDSKRNLCSGFGRKHLYLQIIKGDRVDNIDPSCFSDYKVGDTIAYRTLKDLTTDKECWQAIVDIYKKMYPEPKSVVGWRGDTILIDWLYVLQEVFDLVRMHRWEDDFVDVVDVLDKLNVTY